MKFWADYVLVRTYQDSSSNQRGGSQGLLAPNEVRGIGWGLRNLADAAAYLPNNDPAKAYLVQKVTNNLNWMDTYAASVRGPSNPFGIVFPDKRLDSPTSTGWIALWEQDYVTWAIDHANKQGFIGGLQLRDQIGQFQLKLFTSSPDYPRDQAALSCFCRVSQRLPRDLLHDDGPDLEQRDQ